MNETNENKLSLEERIRQIKERKTKEKEPVFRTSKKILLNVDGELELDRYMFINKFMDQLIESREYSFRVVEIMKRAYIEYNIDMTCFIEGCKHNNDIFYYNAILIYKMIDSGMFDENDYLEISKLKLKNPIEVEKKWIEMINNKKGNKEKNI